MSRQIEIGGCMIGDDCRVFVIAEIGINHNGDIDLAMKLIEAAVLAGCDAVKFQKRSPDLCVPAEQREIIRETPWGLMTYLEYRHRMEFGLKEYSAINEYCQSKKIIWMASCWDEPSVDFIEQFRRKRSYRSVSINSGGRLRVVPHIPRSNSFRRLERRSSGCHFGLILLLRSPFPALDPATTSVHRQSS